MGEGKGCRKEAQQRPSAKTQYIEHDRLRHGRKVGRGKETFSAGEILVDKELMAAVFAANKAVQDRTAVDPVNAMILLPKLESKRFAQGLVLEGGVDSSWEDFDGEGIPQCEPKRLQHHC